MTSEFVSEETWIVVTESDRIVGAFRDVADAVNCFSDDSAVAFRRVPSHVSQQRFVWGVVTEGNELDGVFGGDGESATRRAREIGGELKLFLS